MCIFLSLFNSENFVWDRFLCFIGTILSVTVLPGNNLQFGTVSSGIVLSVHQIETFFSNEEVSGSRPRPI